MKFINDTGLILCSECEQVPINGVYRNDKFIFCEECRDESDEDTYCDIVLNNIVNNYQIHCSNALCDEIIKLADNVSHLALCKYSYKTCKNNFLGCDYKAFIHAYEHDCTYEKMALYINNIQETFDEEIYKITTQMSNMIKEQELSNQSDIAEIKAINKVWRIDNKPTFEKFRSHFIDVWVNACYVHNYHDLRQRDVMSITQMLVFFKAVIAFGKSIHINDNKLLQLWKLLKDILQRLSIGYTINMMEIINPLITQYFQCNNIKNENHREVQLKLWYDIIVKDIEKEYKNSI